MKNYNNSIERKHTRVINIGGVLIGGNNPIAIQSMTNTQNRECGRNGGADCRT